MQGRKKRNGKAKPKKNAPGRKRNQMMQGALPITGSARSRKIGSSEAIPRFKFITKPYRFTQLVRPSQFLTKTAFTGDTWLTGAGVVSGAAAWSINDLPQVGSFGALFDQYRIVKIQIIFEFSGAVAAGAGLYIVEDYDNSTALAGVNEAQEYSSCQFLRPGDSIVIDMIPTAFAGTTILPSPWLDLNTTTTAHFGIKCVSPAGAGNSWQVIAQYTFEMYTVR